MIKSNFAHRMRKITFQNLPWGNFFDDYLSITVYITTRKVVQTLIFPIRNGIFLNQNILNNSLSILRTITQSQNASKINTYRDMTTE